MGSYLDLGSARLWYEERGTGEPLVLLHGGLGDGRVFYNNLAALADRFRVYQVDLRGHGRSPDLPGPLGPTQFADDLVAFLEKAVGTGATPAGYSIGATTALLTAVARPDLVDRLVLISGVFHRDGYLMPPSTEGGVPPVLAQLYAEGTPHEPDHLEVVLGKLAECSPHRTGADLRGAGQGPLPHPGDGRRRRPGQPPPHPRALPGATSCGAGDRAGTSHNLLLEKPELCTHLVREFLTTPPVPTMMPIRRRPAGREAARRLTARPASSLGGRPAPAHAVHSRLCQATADGSVSEATWSMTTRSRAASSAAACHIGANTGSSSSGARSSSAATSSASISRCRCVPRLDARAAHHVPQRDALEQRALGPDRAGHDQVGGVAPQRRRAVPAPGRLDRRRTNRPVSTLVIRFSAAWAAWLPS